MFASRFAIARTIALTITPSSAVALPVALPVANAITAAIEVEPNGTKVDANIIDCLAPGSTIQGSTTGDGVQFGDTSLASADTYRLRTCALSVGVWRHRLILTTTGDDEFTLSVRGLEVVGPSSAPAIVPGSDVPVQASTGSMSGHYVQWFGFGRQEELFVRVTGTSNTLAPYVLTLESVPLAEIVLPLALRAGSVELASVGQGHNTDTELFLLDANRTPIPGFRNDDAPGGGTKQSRLTRALTAGTYTLAVGRFNVTDSALTAADDAYQLAPVLDFPDALLSWSPSGGTDVSFTVADSLGLSAIASILPQEPFQLAWYRITVVDPPPPITTVCFGDGSGALCPCGNHGLPGAGCANSVNAGGGRLLGTGLASVSLDSFVLAGVGMPVSSALYFQGTNVLGGGNGVAFGDGLRCAGGTIVRIEGRTNFGGASSYPVLGEIPISVRGMIPPSGGARVYQLWYRNSDPGFCTSAFYNLTNAVAATWIP